MQMTTSMRHRAGLPAAFVLLALALAGVAGAAGGGGDEVFIDLGRLEGKGGGPAPARTAAPPREEPDLAALRARAEAQEPLAQHLLARRLLAGAPTPAAAADALAWLTAAANQGYAPAMLDLGRLRRDGRLAAKSYFEAIRWFRRAGEAGDVRGQIELGMMYYDGHGVHRDLVEAYVLLALASATIHLAPAGEFASAAAALDELPKELSAEGMALALGNLLAAKDDALAALMRRRPGVSPPGKTK